MTRAPANPAGVATLLRAVLPAILLGGALAMTRDAGAQSPAVTLGSVVGAPMATVDLPIRIDDVTGLKGLDLTFDMNGASLPGVPPPTAGEARLGPGAVGSTVLTDFPGPGQVRVILVDDLGFAAPGTLALIPVTLPAAAGVVYSVHAVDATVDEGARRRAVSIPDASIAVTGTPDPSEPALSVADPPAAAGETVTLIVSLGPVSGVSSVTLTLAGPAPAAGLDPLVFGSALPADLATGEPVESVVSGGRIDLAFLSDRPIAGPGPLISIPVTVPPGTPRGTTFALTFGSVRLAAADGAALPSVVRNGSLAVRGPKPLAGDVNGDGVVDIQDVVLALRIAVGIVAATPGLIAGGDVAPAGAPDHKIDLLDVGRLLQHVVGTDRGAWP